MRSIRRTLLRRLFLGALVLMIVGAILLDTGVRLLLTEQFDTTLRQKLATFATLMEEDGYDIDLGFVEKSMPEYSAAEKPEYFELWLRDGEVLYRSPSLATNDLPFTFGTKAAPLVWDLALPDGRAGRAIGAEFEVHRYEPGVEDPGPAPLVLVVAKDRGTLDRALALLLGGTIAGILLLLGAGFFVVRAAVRSGLLPLEDLARHVSAVDDPLQAPRFPAAQVPEELAPLAESHNQMLDRICRAFERERRTTANIAHELRTPVTELVILSEAAERWSDDPEKTARKLRELREIGGQMSTLISTLLELARMESGQVPLEIESIDLSEMVRDCWSAMPAASESKRFTLLSAENGASPPGGPFVRADRAALSILLSNLLANAVEHAPAGDEIRCELGTEGERGVLVLSNGANGLKAADVDKLTEPFWRMSSARDDRSHAGLGLSLVARLAALLELDLRFRVEAGVFRVELGFSPRHAQNGRGGT